MCWKLPLLVLLASLGVVVLLLARLFPWGHEWPGVVGLSMVAIAVVPPMHASEGGTALLEISVGSLGWQWIAGDALRRGGGAKAGSRADVPS